MKNLLVLAMLSSFSVSAYAENFFCREAKQDAIKAKRVQYAVWIKETSSVPEDELGEDVDYANKVFVSILSRDPKSTAKFKTEKSFESTANVSDVHYNITSREDKVSITLYLDELDQTSVRLPGVRKAIQMTCTGSDHG